jgi:folate-binding protein YgfZ
VAWHYGDPFGEQRLLADGQGWVDLSHRTVVAVSGPDRLGWLHSITTNHMDRRAPGESVLNLVLSPNGHVEHELHMVDDGSTVWITTEAASAPDLLEYLNKMKFMLRVEIKDVSEDVAVVGEPSSLPHPEYPTFVWPTEFAVAQPTDPASVKYVPHRPGSFAGREVLVPRAKLEEYVGDRPGAGTWAWEARRIAAGVPRLGLDVDHRTIPHEVGWVASAVHLNKGCYRGQETVARVHNLGRPPRRLVLLHLDGSDDRTPIVGDRVYFDGRDVGRVTSLAQHFELGPIALAVIKRSVPQEAVLAVGAGSAETVAAAQETVVTSMD